MAQIEPAQKRSFAELIKTIYFYLFSAIGLILVIVGIFQTSEYVVKKFFLPKYDLGYGESCDYFGKIIPAPIDGRQVATTSAEEQKMLDQQKKDCLTRIEEQRAVRQVTDLARAITFIIVGSVVFIFHFRRTKLLT